MTEYEIVRGMLLRTGRGLAASTPMANATLEWAEPHRAWLTGSASEDALEWPTLIGALEQGPPAEDVRPHALLLAARLAELLMLRPVDAALLTLLVACDRLPRVATLAKLLGQHGHDLPTLLGLLAGAESHEADRLVRQSAVLKLGLAGFRANRQGEVEVDVRWTLERLLDRAPAQGEAIIDTLVGARQPARLVRADFAHVRDVDFLVALLRGAVTECAAGINILIHGPPGTGKTELARTLAAEAGLALHAVGEADEDGDVQPQGTDRYRRRRGGDWAAEARLVGRRSDRR